MRSARTGRRDPETDPTHVPHPVAFPAERRALTALCSGLLLLVVLTACASGSAEEARLGQARDAATDPDLPRQQATRTAERFFPKTPTPTPAPPPLPTVAELVMTVGFGGDAPQGRYASVPADAGTVYAAALLNGVHDGQVVAASWVDAVGGTVNTSRVEIEADAGQRWVGLPLDLNGALAPGEYAVYLFVGERRLGSLLFQITPAGSGPQMLSDLPANPVMDRGGPGEVPNQGGRSGAGEDQNRRGGQGNQGNQDGQGVDPNGQDPLYGEQAPPQDQWSQEPAPVIVDQGAGQWVPTATP